MVFMVAATWRGPLFEL